MSGWVPPSSSPDRWARGAGLPDPAVWWGPVPRSQRLVRRAVGNYPLWWRQLHGEELVATTLEILDAQGFAGRRLPSRLRWNLWIAADRERAAVAIAYWRFRWCWLSGRDFAQIDRWKARDVFLDEAARRRRFLWRLLGTYLLLPIAPWSQLASLVVGSAFVAAFGLARALIGLVRYRRAPDFYRRGHRARWLAQFGFTPAGVPFEWLPASPRVSPPEAELPQSPPTSDRAFGPPAAAG